MIISTHLCIIFCQSALLGNPRLVTGIAEMIKLALHCWPTLEYASCIWDPYEKGDIEKIEMVQRRGARFVNHRYHNRSSVSDMIQSLNWNSLEHRRKQSRLILLYKIICEKIAIDPANNLQKPTRQSRTNSTLSYAVPYASTLSHQQSFYPRTIRDWNLLPYEVQSAGSVEAFRAQLATTYA